MKRNFTPEILTDESTGFRYRTKPLAFKNGVLYVELTFYEEISMEQSHRKLAVRAAKYFKNNHSDFEKALAAKVVVLKEHAEPEESMGSSAPRTSVDAIIGIMFQEGMLN